MVKGKWFEVGVIMKDEGTMTLANTDSLKEARQEAADLRKNGEKRPMFIDRWKNPINPVVDGSFKTIAV